MNILYLGDVMGELGIRVLEQQLPSLRRELDVDVVVAQLENLSDGKGIRVEDWQRVQAAGVDAGTGGNWSLHRPEAEQLLANPQVALTRPANYPADTPGLTHKYLQTSQGAILLISLLGQIVGRDAGRTTDNPLHIADTILDAEANTPKIATIINFHGDFSSEKLVIGHYLDGRASIVIGDHWHVPTADAQILPGGTAHQTDAGMCGSLDSCLGVRYDVIEQRWLSQQPSRNELETAGRLQINGLLVTVEPATNKATKLEQVRRIYDQ